MSTKAYLHTGSNMGDRSANLRHALELIRERAGSPGAASRIYETAAWGKEDQPDFLNQALSLQTDLPPRQLMQCLLDIEQQMGRKRRERWGQRLIDIDLLFYGSVRLQIEGLTLPHPRLHKRNFVLCPLREIAPDFVHPELQQAIEQLADACGDPLPAAPFQSGD